MTSLATDPSSVWIDVQLDALPSGAMDIFEARALFANHELFRVLQASLGVEADGRTLSCSQRKPMASLTRRNCSAVQRYWPDRAVAELDAHLAGTRFNLVHIASAPGVMTIEARFGEEARDHPVGLMAHLLQLNHELARGERAAFSCAPRDGVLVLASALDLDGLNGQALRNKMAEIAEWFGAAHRPQSI